MVENKQDLPGAHRLSQFYPDLTHCAISARTGEGVDDLRAAICQHIETGMVVPDRDALLISERHAHALRNVKTALGQAKTYLTDPASPTELAAAHLREAIDALSTITGHIDNERMLDALFARFCIGK